MEAEGSRLAWGAASPAGSVLCTKSSCGQSHAARSARRPMLPKPLMPSWMLMYDSLLKGESGSSWRKHDDRHAQHRNGAAKQVPPGRANAIDQPQPDQRHADIHAAIRRINAPGGGGVDRKRGG